MIKKILFVTLLSLFAIMGNSQSFEAKIITGFAASQIDGDAIAGYNQLGGVFGFATDFKIADNLDFQQEIVYYGRGSRVAPNKVNTNSFTVKGLHYVDISALLNYHVDEKIMLQGGLGYGNLFYLRTDINDNIKNYGGDIFWTFGGGYYLTENIIGGARFQYSLLSMDKRVIAYNNSINFSFRFILSGE